MNVKIKNIIVFNCFVSMVFLLGGCSSVISKKDFDSLVRGDKVDTYCKKKLQDMPYQINFIEYANEIDRKSLSDGYKTISTPVYAGVMGSSTNPYRYVGNKESYVSIDPEFLMKKIRLRENSKSELQDAYDDEMTKCVDSSSQLHDDEIYRLYKMEDRPPEL